MEKAATKDKEEHRWPFAARLAGAAGLVVSVTTAAILKTKLSEKLNEGISDWANSKWGNNFAGGVLEGALGPTSMVSEPNDARILRVVDPKQWRSNVVFWGTLVAGMVATVEIVKQLFPSVRKIEEEHAEQRKLRHAAPHVPAEKSWSQQIQEERSAAIGLER